VPIPVRLLTASAAAAPGLVFFESVLSCAVAVLSLFFAGWTHLLSQPFLIRLSQPNPPPTQSSF
jgi:hypothetical protein